MMNSGALIYVKFDSNDLLLIILSLMASYETNMAHLLHKNLLLNLEDNIRGVYKYYKIVDA